MATDQSSSPFLAISRAIRYSMYLPALSLRAPIVYSRSPTMAGPEKPIPALPNVHSNFGPSLGQALSRPFSLDMLVRSGPWNWGQSSAATDDAKTTRPTKSRIKDRIFIRDLGVGK